MADTISTMLNVIATYGHIRAALTEEKCNKLEKIQSKQTSESIWAHKTTADETVTLCSLNYFITELTNPFNNSTCCEPIISFILTTESS